MHKHYRLSADTLRIRRVASVVAAAYQKTKCAGDFLFCILKHATPLQIGVTFKLSNFARND